MGYINRFLLFLYTLAIALAALGVIVLCLPVFPIPVILNETAFVLSRWETLAVAALVFILSVHLLACSFSGGSKREEKKEKEPEAVVVHGEGGEVRVAVPAVSNLAEKCALKVQGVENANAKVESRRVAGGEGKVSSSVAIRLDLELGARKNVAQVSDAVRAAVSEQVNEVLGLKDYSIDISVAEIAGKDAAKQSRVS
jgi:uncharacterized alkaline shock family protein YloU